MVAAVVGLRAIAILVIAGELGPRRQGEVALAQAIAVVGGALASCGLEVSLVRSSAIAELRPAAAGAFWTHAALVTLATSVAVAALAAAGAGTGAVAAGLVGLAGTLVTRLAAGCALGQERRRAYALLMVVPAFAFLAAVVVLAASGSLTTRAALAAFALAPVGAALALLPLVARWLPPSLLRRPWLAEPYRTGLAAFPGALAHTTNARLDQLVIAIFLPRSDLGLYSVAVASSELTTLPAEATGNVVLAHASAGRIEGRRTVTRAAAEAAVLAALAVPAYVLFVKTALPRYEDSLPLFLVLLPGAAALATGRVLAAYVAGRGRVWATSRVALITAAATLALDLALIPSVGVVGAAVASSLAYALSAALLLRAARDADRRR
ncbi:MAG: lipopolysaccharide biosynthesis protein [Thermoleophilaceae bacterium]